jgi:CheY-like chemotaxis protein
MKSRVLHILLVEDNPADVRLLQETLRQIGEPWRVDIAADGEEACRYLHANRQRPDLVLLDLNLPKKSGHEVLQEIKANADTRTIPVIVFSSSKAEPDVRAAYDLQANCYVGKPGDLDQYTDVVRVIEEFWHKRVELPNPSPVISG